MKRIAITEQGEKTGRWFDAEKAEYHNENTTHNGRNWISDVTGSQWEHESIVVTKSGVFILYHWSNFQGSKSTYEIISKTEAAEWFVKNGSSDDDIPDVFKKSVADLEVV